MANDSGINTEELQQALQTAKSEGDETLVRYYERVLEHRGVRKADVESRDLVLGNKGDYDGGTVEQQEDLALGRPTKEVPFSKQPQTRGAPAEGADEGKGGKGK